MTRHENPCFDLGNAVKADFNDIYCSDDPRAYFKVLGGLDYVIPQIAAPIIAQLAERLIEEKGRPVTVLDLGCSYGLVSAVVRHGVTMDQLRDRYAAPAIRGLSPDRLAAADANYFASWPARSDIRMIGLDCSAKAVGYAHRVGLVDEAIVADLEVSTLTKRAAEVIAKADLIVSTGAVGYISEKTFQQVLGAFPEGQAPWVAAFVLRMFDYEQIAKTLKTAGLETEKFEGATFVQRRFHDEAEFKDTLRLLAERGVDPAGKEAEGLFHAELFVSRPEEAIAAERLNDIVSLASGAERRFADRFRVSSPRRLMDGMAA